MRIRFVVPRCTPDNSHGRYVIELAKRLGSEGDLTIYSGAFWQPLRSMVRCRFLPVLSRPALARLATLWSASALTIRRRPGEIVHVQGADAPVGDVITAHSCCVAQRAAAGAGVRLRRRFNYAIGAVAEQHCMANPSVRRIIAVSEKVKREIEREYGIDPRKIVVIHHGVDADTFHPGNRLQWRASVRERLGFSGGDFVIAYVGGDYRLKGLPTLLHAAGRLRGPVKVLAIGVSPDKRLAQLLRQHEIGALVSFIPTVADIAPLYAATDCFVLPTLYDTFSLSTLEAMASGLPVIVSSEAGVAELLSSNRDSLVLENPHDSETLTELLQQLIRDEGLRSRLSIEGRRTAERHSWDEVASRTVSLYRETVQVSRARPTPAVPHWGSRAHAVRPLRLCFVVESGTDVRLVDGLADRFELTVLARDVGRPISHPPKPRANLVIGPKPRGAFGRLVWRELVSGAPFDAVLVQGYSVAALSANLAARLRRVPTFMLICSPTEQYYRCRKVNGAPESSYRFWEYAGITCLARINARLGQRYIVLSEHLADLVRSHGTSARIDLVPVYGVDTSVFRPSNEAPSSIRRRLGLPEAAALVFFSSRVAPEKDSDTLLAAFRALLRDGREIRLLHRSGGYRVLLEKARRFGVERHVTATDARHPLEGLAGDYQACDVCVQASLEEGLGFSALEALACGVPVVATAVGGLRETIIDGETGWTYPVGDAEALARCVAAVLDQPEEARLRAAAGRKLVAQRYESRSVFDQLDAVLRGVD